MQHRHTPLHRRRNRVVPYDPIVCLRLAVSTTAVALGLVGLAVAGVRVGWLLLVAQGEELLVPMSAALIGLGLGGIALTLAAARRRAVLAALGIGVLGVAVGMGARAVSAVAFADHSGGVFVAYRERGSTFAWPLAWSLVTGPALAVVSATLVVLAVVAVLTLLVRRLTRPRPITS